MINESTRVTSLLSIVALVSASAIDARAAAPAAPAASASSTAAPPAAPPGAVPIAPQAEPPPPPEMAGPPGAEREPPRRGEGPAADVQYQPDEPGVTLLMQNGVVPVGYGYRWRGWYRHGWYYGRGYAPSYQPICNGPCTARFTPGAYDFALERNGRIIPAEGPAMITGPSVLHAQYVDRSGLRVAGLVIGIGGIIAGTIMIFASVERDDYCDPSGLCYVDHTVDGPLLAGGIGVLIGSAIVGSVLAWQRDEANITVLPLRLSSLAPREGGFGQALPEGAALRIRF